jgi:D-arabinan exo alpha-(1,3)/(1,5)-arabinofuranosidase (non-reducing end)
MHCRTSTNFLSLILFVLIFAKASYSQRNYEISSKQGVVSLEQQLRSYYDISLLPQYLNNTIVAQTSTYDTTGGNNDGFNGTYSFLRKDKDSNLVIFDINGPGVINRIWTPTPTDDTLDFYIDDSLSASFSIKYIDLFSGRIFPFIRPLCGNDLGGFYCYLPIPFQTHCKIICRAKQTQFHQIQYRLYPQGTAVEKFSTTLNEEEKTSLKKIVDLWREKEHTVKDFYPNEKKFITSSKTIMLLPGETKTIFNTQKGGRIIKILFDNPVIFEGLQKQIDIRMTWDSERTPAAYCPVADFFGYAFGKISMRSLLLGTRADKNYCWLPMPFDKSARIELIYRKNLSSVNKPLRINATVIYSNEKRDTRKEGKFYTSWHSNKLLANAPAHIFLNTKGKGHYIGSLLLAQGMQPGMTYFFEGDDSTATDNVFRIHGTGSEDYFNGGWYALPDRWSKKMSLPLQGALDYSLPFCRTGGYRFYMGDKISFEKNIYESIEHGPVHNSIPVDYTSLAFYYCNTPPQYYLKPLNELSSVYIPDTMIMYPQLMNFSVWHNITSKASWMYNTGGESFTFTATDDSRLLINLDPIPDGTYRLYADITRNAKGCEFSLWQGQSNISGWINTAKQGQEERMPMLYTGDLNVDEFSRSIAVQFKTSATFNNFLLSRLIFVKEKK